MWKFITTLIEWLILFLIIRSVVVAVARFFRGMSQPASTHSGSRPPGELHSAGELRKDPVCQTYISVPSPWAKLVKGETLYFCSKECKDRYKS